MHVLELGSARRMAAPMPLVQSMGTIVGFLGVQILMHGGLAGWQTGIYFAVSNGRDKFASKGLVVLLGCLTTATAQQLPSAETPSPPPPHSGECFDLDESGTIDFENPIEQDEAALLHPDAAYCDLLMKLRL